MARRPSLLLLAATAACCAAATGCGTGAGGPTSAPVSRAPSREPGGTVVVDSDAVLGSLDPARMATPLARSVAFATCTPLLTYADAEGDAGRTLVPGLAVDVPDTSPDFRTFTFTLRNGLRFADGRPLQTADIRYAFERLLSPRMHSPAAVLFDDIVGADRFRSGAARTLAGIAVSKHGVTFHLKTGDPGFLARVALPAACPVEQGTPVHDLGGAIWRRQATGPYRMLRATPRRVVLVRNPTFPRATLGARGVADRIQLNAQVAPAAALAGLRAGRADLAVAVAGVPAGAAAAGTVTTLPADRLGVLAIDPRVLPFDSVRVRQAVNLAVDRTALAARMGGPHVVTPATQLLPPTFAGWDPAAAYPLRGAPATARERLLQSGAPLPVQATLAAPAGARWRAAARLVASELGRSGFHVRLLPSGSRGAAALRLTAYGPAYPDPEDPIVSLGVTGARETGTARPRRLLDPRLDRELRRARRAVGPARSELFGRLADRVARDVAPTAVLWHANFQEVTSSRLMRMVAHPVYLVDLPALGVRP